MAWHPLGWEPAWFCEVEKFPAAVLAHHYPGIPNRGDMTKFKEWPDGQPIQLLVGGTPCQSFSVAGLRGGLDDPRGNLMLTYLAIASRHRPRWCVWENVPGVLSSNGGRDFGTFLTGLGELGYGFAYRVLDAQYVRVDGLERAVPQRRRRVFVIGYLGDWRRAAAVLFDAESMSGNSPPRREAWQEVASTISARPTCGGGLGTDFDCDGGLIASTGPVSHCLNAGGMGRIDYESETMIAHTLRGAGFDASEDGTGRGTPIVPIIADTMTACGDANSGFRDHRGLVPIAIQERAVSENPDNGPGGAGFRADGAAYTLEARNRVQAVTFGSGAHTTGHQGDRAFGDGDAWATLGAQGGNNGGGGGGILCSPHVLRRLTPTECERLQGFPDGWTAIPYRNKPADQCPDGPRYKALGNSMAVNVMRWIGRRIEWVGREFPPC